jgi:hypothetical protein
MLIKNIFNDDPLSNMKHYFRFEEKEEKNSMYEDIKIACKEKIEDFQRVY